MLLAVHSEQCVPREPYFFRTVSCRHKANTKDIHKVLCTKRIRTVKCSMRTVYKA